MTTPYPQQPGWVPVPRRTTPSVVAEVIGISLGLLAALTVLGVIVSTTGGNVVVAGALAFIPLLGVLWAIRWIDRWEPEPRLTLVAAFLWGAGVSTLISLFFNTVTAQALSGTGASVIEQLAISSAVVAPMIEETTKGLGVLLVFLLRRRSFDGPVDGVVYAATVAVGFAFVENILYFTEYSDSVGALFVGRAIMSPFAHVIFTSMTGLALGIASRQRSRAAWVGLFPVGLVLAMMLHGLWNFSSLSTRYVFLYFALQVPLFLTLTALVYWLRHQERTMLARRLEDYARAGWFSAAEVGMLTSLRERRRAMKWAASRGRGAAMKTFQRAATEAAYLRERAAVGNAPATFAADEAAYLNQTATARAALYA